MRNLKKILALVLSLMMVLSVMVTASAADYSDADDIQYTEAVEVMSALGILSGADGKFAPQGTLTRDQAAKIIAYVVLGADAADLVKGTGSDLFVDVTGGWAYDYVSFCANEGIINGYTVDGKLHFGPGGTLTGYQFGKMLLNAVGIEGKYTGSGWEIPVATALKENGILAGLASNFALKNSLTREEAAQMALNAMKIGTTTVISAAYYECNNVKFASAAEAYFYSAANSNASVTYVPAVTETNALLSVNYGLSWTETNKGSDSFGRPATLYWDTATNGDEFFTGYTATPVAAYNAPVAISTIYTDLGLSSSKDAVWYIDGWQDNVNTKLTLTRTATTSYIGGNGVSVEVYFTNGVYTVVQVANYLGTVTKVVDYKPATATTNAQYAYVEVALYGTDYCSATETPRYTYYTYVDSGLKKGDMVIATAVNKHSGYDMVIKSLTPAVSVVGTTTKYSASAIVVDNTSYAVAEKFNGTVASVIDFQNAKVYYTDGNGVVYGTDKVTPVIPTNYVYVSSVQAQAASTGSLLGNSTGYAAKANVVFTDGTAAIVDLAMYYNTSNQVCYDKPGSNGKTTPTSITATDNTSVTVNTWFAYEIDEDGDYTLSEVNSTFAKVMSYTRDANKLPANSSTTVGGKYLTSGTVVTGFKANATNTGYNVTSFVGLPTSDIALKDTKVLVTYAKDSNVAANIYVMGASVEPTVSTTTYAWALQAGSTTPYGTEWTVAIDGEQKTIVVAANSSVTAGNAYTLTYNSKYDNYTTASVSFNGNGKVTVADSAYIVVNNRVVLLDKDCVVYNVSTGNVGTVDTIEAGDTVHYVTNTAGKLALVYITVEAE